MTRHMNLRDARWSNCLCCSSFLRMGLHVNGSNICNTCKVKNWLGQGPPGSCGEIELTPQEAWKERQDSKVRNDGENGRW